VFLFAMDPHKIRTMMDDLEGLDPALVEKMAHNKRGVLMGRERLASINKQVGEFFSLTLLNYKGITLEFEVIGLLPEGRYDQNSSMNRDYINDAVDQYAREHGGKAHSMATKSLNLVWVKVPDTDVFQRVADQVMSSALYTAPSVKCETASSGISSWLEP